MTTGEYIDVTPSTDGGVRKKILVHGTGSIPKPGDTVQVKYIGTVNKVEFDRNPGGYPYSFKLGGGAVIRGWEVAFPTMNVGEKAEILVRSDYGYGEDGGGNALLAGATLKFVVELLSIKSEPSKSGNVDLERLEQIRQQREEAANKRKAELEAREKSKREAQEKLKAKLANKALKGKPKKKKSK